MHHNSDLTFVLKNGWRVAVRADSRYSVLLYRLCLLSLQRSPANCPERQARCTLTALLAFLRDQDRKIVLPLHCMHGRRERSPSVKHQVWATKLCFSSWIEASAPDEGRTCHWEDWRNWPTLMCLAGSKRLSGYSTPVRMPFVDP